MLDFFGETKISEIVTPVKC